MLDPAHARSHRREQKLGRRLNLGRYGQHDVRFEHKECVVKEQARKQTRAWGDQTGPVGSGGIWRDQVGSGEIWRDQMGSGGIRRALLASRT